MTIGYLLHYVREGCWFDFSIIERREMYVYNGLHRVYHILKERRLYLSRPGIVAMMMMMVYMGEMANIGFAKGCARTFSRVSHVL